MIDKRLFLVLPALALLAACGKEAADEGGAATGEVLEGTISDAMLPLDRTRSDPPLEDPEAFVEVQAEAAEEAEEAGAVADEGSEAGESEAGDAVESEAEDAPPEEPAAPE